MALSRLKADSLNLADNFTFTGNVTGEAVGALNLLQTQTASSSASISFTTGIDSTYDEYWFVFNNIHPATDAVRLTFQGSTDGRSNYNTTITSTCFRAQHDEIDGDPNLLYNPAADQAQGTAFQKLMDERIGNGSDESCSGILKLYNPSSTTYVKHFSSRNTIYQRDNYINDNFVAGYFNTTSAINAVSFKMDSGNIDDGTIQMFGVTQ